jgi:hypothetical protein
MAVVNRAGPMRGIGERARCQKPSKRGVGLAEESAFGPQEESKVVQ